MDTSLGEAPQGRNSVTRLLSITSVPLCVGRLAKAAWLWGGCADEPQVDTSAGIVLTSTDAQSAVSEEENEPDDVQTLCAARLQQLEKQRAATMAKVIEIEADIIETKAALANATATCDGEGHGKAHFQPASIINPSSLRHLLDPAPANFDPDDLLAAFREIKEAHPEAHNLPSIYLSMAEGMNVADGVPIPLQDEIALEGRRALDLLREVLTAPPLTQLSAVGGVDEAVPDGTADYLQSLRDSETAVVHRVKSIEQALHKAKNLAARTQPELFRRPCESLATYLKDLLQKISSAQSTLTANKTKALSAQLSKMGGLEKDIADLTAARNNSMRKIEEARELIDQELERVLQTVAAIAEKERTLDETKLVRAKTEESVGSLEESLSERHKGCAAAIDVVKTLLDTNVSLQRFCHSRVTETIDELEKMLMATHSSIYQDVQRHWTKVVELHKAGLQRWEETKQLLGHEMAAVRSQRQSGAPPSILSLQEQLVKQREQVATTQKQEVERIEAELRRLSSLLDHLGTVTALRGHKDFADVVEDDFRTSFDFKKLHSMSSQEACQPANRGSEPIRPATAT